MVASFTLDLSTLVAAIGIAVPAILAAVSSFINGRRINHNTKRLDKIDQTLNGGPPPKNDAAAK